MVEDFKRLQRDSKFIDFKTEIAPDVFVYFDPYHLEQVVWNLLQNAREAVPHTGRIHLKMEISSSDENQAKIEVKDTGVGISEKDRAQIFDPFFTTKKRGTGLGLSIISRILEEGGGRISLSANDSSETVFTVYVPISD